jgi:pyridoxamine 5'-phosphate oxidase
MLRDLTKNNKSYSFGELDIKDVDKNPINQFVKWLDFADESGIDDFNAMIVSTVGEGAKPSSRVVLLKSVTNEGLIFYTNYSSKKGNQISINPNVSVVFFWSKLERQIRVEGYIEKVSSEISDNYFSSRPVESQMGAIISPQSQVIPSREYLIEKKDELEQGFEGKKLIRPVYWGGFIIKPNLFEFWQGRENRLSDRIQYRITDQKWLIERLAP